MKNIKLIDILRTFSAKEFKEFEKFVSSPYFNTGRKYIIKAFVSIKEFYPSFDNENFTKEIIYKRIYPEEAYNDLRMRKILSGLMSLAEEFLSIDSFRKNKYEMKSFLLGELALRKLDNILPLQHKEAEKITEATPFKTERYYYKKHLLNRTIKHFYFLRNRELSLNYFDPEIENYITHFLIYILSLYIERFKEKRSFTEKDFSAPMLEEVLLYIKKSSIDNPVIMTLYYELMLYIEGKEEYYYKLKEELEKPEELLDKPDLGSLYNSLTNYAAQKSEKGDIKFRRETYEIYKTILEKELIEEYLSGFLFLNIVTLALSFGEFDFAENFIVKYKERLHPSDASPVVNYSYANISFAKKQYGKTLEILSKVSFQNNAQKTLVKNLTIKCYYELNEGEALYSVIESYRRQLKREKLLPQNIKHILYNFIDFTESLMKMKNSPNFKETEQIKKRIEGSAAADKIWLIEKVNKMLTNS